MCKTYLPLSPHSLHSVHHVTVANGHRTVLQNTRTHFRLVVFGYLLLSLPLFPSQSLGIAKFRLNFFSVAQICFYTWLHFMTSSSIHCATNSRISFFLWIIKLHCVSMLLMGRHRWRMLWGAIKSLVLGDFSFPWQSRLCWSERLWAGCRCCWNLGWCT